MAEAEAQSADATPGVAIFDLDKTLTVRSSYTPFILFAAKRRPWRFLHAPNLLFLGLLMMIGLRHRDDVKQAMWSAVMGGLSRTDATHVAAAFAEHWIATALRPQARAAITRHIAAGDRLILATAAMDLVAVPFGQTLGFHDTLATRTEWTPKDTVSGDFQGENCYGHEKLRRVEALLGAEPPPQSTAYSDHVTDLPLLTWVTTGVAVNPHAPLTAAIADAGLETQDWGG